MGLNEREFLEQQITILFVRAMADTMEYFVKDIQESNGGIVISKRMDYALERINHFSRTIVADVAKKYKEEVVNDFAHDADLLRHTMRKFMSDLIENIMKRDDREDNQ